MFPLSRITTSKRAFATVWACIYTGQPSTPKLGLCVLRSSDCFTDEWQWPHSDCRLLLSKNSVWFPLCGMMWSTMFAVLIVPCVLQYWHSGCFLRCRALILCHCLVRYQCDHCPMLRYPITFASMSTFSVRCIKHPKPKLLYTLKNCTQKNPAPLMPQGFGCSNPLLLISLHSCP